MANTRDTETAREMELTDETWQLVRATPKVTGFVGSGSKPVALPQDQVDEMLVGNPRRILERRDPY